MRIRKIITVATVLTCSVAFADPASLDTFEDFEGIVPNTAVGAPINLGTSPNTATLGGDAFAGVIGVGPLYHSGVRAWMVLDSGIGSIDFTENNAATVEFFVRTHPSADGDTIVTAFDDDGGIIGSAFTIAAGFSDPSDPAGEGFTLVSFSGDIDSITVENTATNFMNGVDDFGFTSVPEPTALALAVIALPLLLRRRR